MPTTAIYTCKTCRCAFTARIADRARGWARYCSKSCKAIKQTRRTGVSGRRITHVYLDDLAYQEPPAFGSFHDHDDIHPRCDDAFGPA